MRSRSTRSADWRLVALLGGLVALAIALSVVETASGALRYSTDIRDLENDGTPKPLSVLCPGRTKVVGGGVGAIGGAPEEDVEVSSTAPDDLGAEQGSQRDDGWIAEAVNSSDAAGLMSVEAICSTSGAPKYRQGSLSLPDGSVVGRRVLCPSGSHVTGGGVTTTGRDKDLEVAATFPVDDGDRGTTPDDGWTGRASNQSGGDERMTVFAICAQFSTLKYRSSSVQAPGQSTVRDSVGCPAGTRATGGGVDITRGGLLGPGFEVAGTQGDDGGDRDDDPDDRWVGRTHNDDPDPARMTTFVICQGTPIRSFSGTFSEGGTVSFSLTNDGTKVHNWAWVHMPIQCREGPDVVSSHYRLDVEVTHHHFHAEAVRSPEGFKTTLDGTLTNHDTKARGTLSMRGPEPPTRTRCHGTGHWSATAQ